MKKPWRKLTLGVLAVLVASWFVDPVAIRLQLRYPRASVTDNHDYRWLLPAFLHAYWAPADDLEFGRYLSVELSDQAEAIDFSGFAKSRVYLVVLNRCRVADLQPIISCPERIGVVFNDCDLSGLPESQRGQLDPLPGSNRLSLNGS